VEIREVSPTEGILVHPTYPLCILLLFLSFSIISFALHNLSHQEVIQKLKLIVLKITSRTQYPGRIQCPANEMYQEALMCWRETKGFLKSDERSSAEVPHSTI
jgi:hypothetical protein